MKNKFLAKLFSELEYLNTVPKFQLERAVSPLLGIFIEEIINNKYAANVIASIPEFPLKKIKNFQSTNIDWLLIDKINNTLYCVELKTDSHSFRDTQLKKYIQIQEIVKTNGAAFLFEQLNLIAPKSNRKDKYSGLLKFIDDNSYNFSVYKNFEIIYLVPDDSKLDDRRIKRLNFSQLPKDISIFNEEWQQLRKLLIKLGKKSK